MGGLRDPESTTRNPRYTGYVQRNLTLTIDEQVLRAARKIAIDRNSSVNQMVRDYLNELVKDPAQAETAAARFRNLVKKSRARIGSSSWKRDELYDRRADSLRK